MTAADASPRDRAVPRSRPPLPPLRPGVGRPVSRTPVPRTAVPRTAVPRTAVPPPPLHRPPSGRVRGFVWRWGWRAYALPLLTVATVVTLVQIVVPGTSPAASAPAPTSAGTSAVPTHVSAAPAGDAGPSTSAAVSADVSYVDQGAGSVSVVDGTSPVHGTGPLKRFVVEVEDGTGVDGTAFAAAVQATLGDPRSWGNGGRLAFQRVGVAEAAAGRYDFRVTLVSPGNMEKYCPGVGTGGYTSCRYGERAVINLARWETAVPDYAGDVATYRQYVVNHEVGHALGHGHEQCPGSGAVAPVMQQQTLGLDGCVKNAWPYP